jgi:hypothetical protein
MSLQPNRCALLVLAGLPWMSLAAAPSHGSQGKTYTVPELAKTMSPAVVFIGNADGSGQVTTIGSGFVVNADGLIVTNYHVIAGAQGLQIKMKDGEIYDRVDVQDYDTRRDIAVLKIRPFKKLPTLALSDSAPEPGEDAVAIGNPQGLEHTVSVGVVSAYRQAEGYRLIQISVPISPGSSGGPLFNLKGEVVGITSSGVVAEGAQNLNFAVPIDYARPLIQSTSAPVPIAEFTKKVGGTAPYGASSGGAPASPSGGGNSAWRVAHDHGDTFETYCLGTLYLSGANVGYTNDSKVHVWEVPLAAVKEVAKNAVYGADKSAFHIKVVTGSNFNFVALNDQLQFVPTDSIVLAILGAIPAR